MEDRWNFGFKDTMVLEAKKNIIYCNGEFLSRDEFYTLFAMETSGNDETDFDIYFSQCCFNAWVEANFHNK